MKIEAIVTMEDGSQATYEADDFVEMAAIIESLEDVREFTAHPVKKGEQHGPVLCDNPPGWS